MIITINVHMSFPYIITGLNEERVFLLLQWMINPPSALSRCIYYHILNTNEHKQMQLLLDFVNS